ncbi:hypothetical protein GCU67_11230 [Modestobacter muralis]|uniref:Uncharacterized protein n=1 Tax=Modestobacter muralis TaxID=1608614 RepID=A0A6P0EUB5_9ACTN|nr:hypothetical protein [Modestobacter muralis]NEK94737.1 hypothetical protein [Modestobacter muralis]NEN51625.1 hypothetical protein [Modestobacter muralis]
MSDLEGAVRVLRSIADVMSDGGALAQLRGTLHRQPALFADLRLQTEIFSGMPPSLGFDGSGAGASAFLSAQRADGGLVVWTVEVWIDTWAGEGQWSALVKAEIEAGGPSEDTESVLVVQRTVHDAAAAALAVRECAGLIAAHPLADR